MQRTTISIDDDLLETLDAFMQISGAGNRSEALRDLMRRSLTPEIPEDADCVAIISYSMDPSIRELGLTVPISRQQLRDSTVAALSVPVDHKTALEVTVMLGKVKEVSDYANSLFHERNVRHSRLALIPVDHGVQFRLQCFGKTHGHSHFPFKATS